MQDFVNGNVNSYYIILNDEKSLVKYQGYNYMSVGLAMLNAEKDMIKKETMSKKVIEATDKARKKTEKYTEEASKRNESLSGFKGGLYNSTNDVHPHDQPHCNW